MLSSFWFRLRRCNRRPELSGIQVTPTKYSLSRRGSSAAPVATQPAGCGSQSGCCEPVSRTMPNRQAGLASPAKGYLCSSSCKVSAPWCWIRNGGTWSSVTSWNTIMLLSGDHQYPSKRSNSSCATKSATPRVEFAVAESDAELTCRNVAGLSGCTTCTSELRVNAIHRPSLEGRTSTGTPSGQVNTGRSVVLPPPLDISSVAPCCTSSCPPSRDMPKLLSPSPRSRSRSRRICSSSDSSSFRSEALAGKVGKQTGVVWSAASAVPPATAAATRAATSSNARCRVALPSTLCRYARRAPSGVNFALRRLKAERPGRGTRATSSSDSRPSPPPSPSLLIAPRFDASGPCRRRLLPPTPSSTSVLRHFLKSPAASTERCSREEL
mmetsp:Transcript_33333/g.59663  ORF Transcript_33333/g.59663 Transcript_33333/m.59663 type:complete len:382 (+) Transcript_33333:737-1882(+)